MVSNGPDNIVKGFAGSTLRDAGMGSEKRGSSKGSEHSDTLESVVAVNEDDKVLMRIGTIKIRQPRLVPLLYYGRYGISTSGNWKADLLLLILFLGGYLCIGSWFYCSQETYEDGSSWTLIDALYFLAATMSTVGYGDLSPGTDETRWFTVGMIFFGIIFIFPKLGSVIGMFLEPFKLFGRRKLEDLFPMHAIDIDGDGEIDYQLPRTWWTFYLKNMIPDLILMAVVQFVSAAAFVAVEPGLTFGKALYHCTTTASTVGYGDVSIETQEGRLLAFIHMIVSVCTLAEVINTLGQIGEERKELKKRAAQLQRRMDGHLWENLFATAQALRPIRHHAENGEEGLGQMEFVVAMLVELEIVKVDQVRPFLKQFTGLDKNQDGILTLDDTQRSTAMFDLAMEKQKDKKSKVLLRQLTRQNLSYSKETVCVTAWGHDAG